MVVTMEVLVEAVMGDMVAIVEAVDMMITAAVAGGTTTIGAGDTDGIEITGVGGETRGTMGTIPVVETTTDEAVVVDMLEAVGMDMSVWAGTAVVTVTGVGAIETTTEALIHLGGTSYRTDIQRTDACCIAVHLLDLNNSDVFDNIEFYR